MLARAVLVGFLMGEVARLSLAHAAPPSPSDGSPGPVTVSTLRSKKDEFLSKGVTLRAILVQLYECPACPKGQKCPPCDQPHFFVADSLSADREDWLMVVDYLFARQKPPALTVGKKYDVHGTFALRSPTGFASTNGLLLFDSMVDDRGLEFVSPARALEVASNRKARDTTGGVGNSNPTAAGCTKDTDCKGERVCEQGRCVSPRSAGGPSESDSKATGAECRKQVACVDMCSANSDNDAEANRCKQTCESKLSPEAQQRLRALIQCTRSQCGLSGQIDSKCGVRASENICKKQWDHCS